MKLIKRFGASFHTRTGAYIFFVLAAVAFFLMRSAAKWAGWLPEIYGEYFASAMLVAIGACALILLGLLFLAGKMKEYRALCVIHTVFCVLAGVLFGFTLVLNFGLDNGPNWPGIYNGLQFLQPNLLYLGLALGLPFFILLYPKLKKSAKIFTALLICIAVALPIAIPCFQAQTPFEMTTNPLVLDIGGDHYSVVFATNRNSTAYLRYTFEGEEFTVANAFSGRMNVGRVHSMRVPRDHLNANSYYVIVREVLSSLDSGTQFGVTIESPVFNFRGEYKDGLNILIATDWHAQPEKVLAAAAHLPAPDLLLMLGDLSGYNFEDNFILYTIAAGADITNSVIPAIYARGNHEMYGEMTHVIFPGLGLDSFYYQVRRGNILFTVADGADWSGERLDFSEFVRGTANSENDLFREEQLAWLADLEPGDEASFHFAAVHRPAFGNNEQRILFYEQLNRLGVDIQFSGDEHNLRLDQPGHERYNAPHPLLIAGGPMAGYGGDYIVSFAQVHADGAVHLLACDSTGVQHLDEIIQIRN